jgi:hypothetical protein
MKPIDNVEKLIRDLHVLEINTSSEMDKRILHDTLKVQRERNRTKLAGTQPDIWRTIMKNPITKLAVAAIIVVIGLGILTFINTGSKSGLVWAEVAQKVEASPGVIFRIRKTGSGDPNDQWPNGYTVMQRNATLSRTDWYRGNQIHRTVYFDLVGKTEIWVAHDKSVYSRQMLSDEKIQKMQADGLGWTDPQGLLNLGLSLEHHALGQRAIDGVLCEGLEATGPDGSTARVWVSVETGYPVLVEVEAIDDKGIRHTSTLDQFQWNVDLSAEDVEPEIPADYESLGLEGEMKTLSEQGKRELIRVEETMTDGTLQMRVHVYRYKLSDGRTIDDREGAGGVFALGKAQMEEYFQLRKAGPGENLGSYEETVEGRVFSFKREKYILSNGTEIIYSVGTPRDEQ